MVQSSINASLLMIVSFAAMKTFVTLLTFVSLSLLFACQTEPLVDTQIIETTRVVVETEQVIATVQVPVEVTREIFIPVTVELIERVEVVEPPVGSAENPIRLVFTPRYGEQVTIARATNLISVLQAETDLAYEIVTPADYPSTVAAACEAPERTIAFLTVQSFVLASEQCDLQVGYAGIRDGVNWRASMVMVPEVDEGELTQLSDLEGRSWGVQFTNNFVESLYWQAIFSAENITPGIVTEFETDASAVIAGNDGVVDFVTASYLPPIYPRNEYQWVYGVDDPESWRATGSMPFRSGIGYVVVETYVDQGGWRVRDARAIALDSRPFIFINTDIMLLSEQIPNDAIAFGAGVPLGIVRQIGRTIEAHAVSEDCQTSLCSSDLFAWEGVTAVDDSFYDAVRFVMEELSLSAETIAEIVASE